MTAGHERRATEAINGVYAEESEFCESRVLLLQENGHIGFGQPDPLEQLSWCERYGPESTAGLNTTDTKLGFCITLLGTRLFQNRRF